MIKFLVYDFGLYVHQAEALADGGKNRVKYYTPWPGREPHYKDYCIGKNFGHLEKELYFEKFIDWADAIIFFDVSGNSYCDFLRKKYPEKSVFGCGLGEQLENDRVLLKEWCAEFDLQVSKYEVVKGVTKLKELLKKTNGGKYVKMNIFRGDMESFLAPDFATADSIIDQEVVPHLGMHKEDYDFVVEDLIDTDVEIGFDGFFNGKNYIQPYFVGYEYSKGLYIAHVTDKLPIAIQETMESFIPLFTKMNYRGAISSEEKVVSKNENYFIDGCMRLPNPLSALYPVMIGNWAEAVYKIGKGEDVELDIKHKYVGAFPLMSLYAKENYVKVDIKDLSKARYQMCCGKGKDVYAVPGWEIVAIVVAGGDSVDEVISKLKENVKYVDGHGVDKDPVNGIDVIKDIIKNGEKVGIKFT